MDNRSVLLVALLMLPLVYADKAWSFHVPGAIAPSWTAPPVWYPPPPPWARGPAVGNYPRFATPLDPRTERSHEPSRHSSNAGTDATATETPVTPPPSADTRATERDAEQARALIQEFAAALKSELTGAISQGGLVSAVGVCHVRAPQIAAELGESSGWDIGRTSVRRRNADNGADAWERGVLADFELRKAAGEPIAGLEHIDATPSSFRYMKAIPTEPVCLGCHGGDSVDPTVASVIESFYPDDLARGFAAGDIRGAFSLTKAERGQ